MSQLTKEDAVKLAAINLMASVMRDDLVHAFSIAETENDPNKPDPFADLIGNRIDYFVSIVMSTLSKD